MRSELRGAAVVITGASSGIGRVTARRFAEEGASLVLVARRARMLEEAADECRARGVDAVAVPGDVAEPADMQRAADEAMRRFGAIDVWVNNAGVMMFGRFEDTPMDDFRRVLETNLFGVVNGTRAALPYMIRRNKGVIINNASIVGHLGQPYSAAYVTSKFAVRGFTVALRQELSDRPGINVCAVLPSSIDTPLWQHAANYTGRALRAFRPASDPAIVADAIVSLAERPRREVVVGAVGKAMVFQHRFFPDATERLMSWSTKRSVFRRERAAPYSGTLHYPISDGLGARGGWRTGSGNSGLLAAGALALLPLAVMVWHSRRRA
jgi:short-subunit dehydrogenase